ncbi:Fatty acid desaturase [Labrenzia sp. THAF82]|uniref:fatty acid desaturase family protein n=1 Tax=Labrenzia sp. THAF82 TaxID=2587861 RepID=UPI0012695FE7|nr:fatty acid desaturase family protein [Labrenzia sp. THAF82]QFT33961.1 Fatty acid desaturase [Labrenzia sp. THAF82]
MEKRKIEKHRFSDEIVDELVPLTKIGNWRIVLLVAEDYVIIGFCIALCLSVSWLFYPLAWLVIGSRQRGLANIMHAAAHGTAACHPAWNYMVGTVFAGYLVGQQFVRYIQTHVVRHHGMFGTESADPDYRQQIELGFYLIKNPRQFYNKFVRNALLGLMIPKYILYIVKDRFLSFRESGFPEVRSIVTAQQDRIFFTIQWLVILTASVYFGFFWILIAFWIVPLFTSAMIIGWFIELSEHFPLMESGEKDIYMSRNRQGNFIEHFLAGVHNDDYHLEHHLNPRIPMWNLKKASKIRAKDPEYQRWNKSCAGIFSRGEGAMYGDTLFQHIAKEHLIERRKA